MSNSNTIEPIYLPRGVASPDKRIGFVTVDLKAIEAIDLLNGKSLWQALEKGLPLIVFEDKLAALQAPEGIPNQLRVVILELGKRGELAFKSDPIIFPSWVTVTLLPSEFFNFDVLLGEDKLVLRWHARSHYQGGAPPPAYVVAQATKDEVGSARIGLKSGKVKMLSDQGEPDTELPAVLQQAMFFSYQRGSSGLWSTEPWDIANQKAVITGEVSADYQRLYLQKWNALTREVEKPVFLVEGRALVSYVTPDGHFLFIHSEALAVAQASARVSWWVFSVETGSLESELEYEMGARDPCILGSNVYYIVEERSDTSASGATIRYLLKSRFLLSGSLQWERLFSEQGVTPPALRP